MYTEHRYSQLVVASMVVKGMEGKLGRVAVSTVEKGMVGMEVELLDLLETVGMWGREVE